MPVPLPGPLVTTSRPAAEDFAAAGFAGLVGEA